MTFDQLPFFSWRDSWRASLFSLDSRKLVDRASVAVFCSLRIRTNVYVVKMTVCVFFYHDLLFACSIFCSVGLIHAYCPTINIVFKSVMFIFMFKLVVHFPTLFHSLARCRFVGWFVGWLVIFFVRWLICYGSLDSFKSNL